MMKTPTILAKDLEDSIRSLRNEEFKMEYYGNNDFRDYRKTNDYLAHHGILGMKWGIRRFQPYSIHPRKGGEGGKEIGEARQSNAHVENQKKLKSNTSGRYESMAKSYKSAKTNEDFDRLYKTDPEKLSRTIEKKSGGAVSKPVGKYLKAALAKNEKEREEAYTDWKKRFDAVTEMERKAVSNALQKYPKFLRNNNRFNKKVTYKAMRKLGKSDTYKKAINNLGSNSSEEQRINRLCDATLMDLGYPVNAKNRKRVKELAFYH